LLLGATAILSTLLVNAASISPRRVPLWRRENDPNWKARGVSTGGWLLLESWIKPSLFEQFTNMPGFPGDEWSFCQQLGKVDAANQLRKHWDSFYTADDFHQMASYGLNLARISIGYWAFEVRDDEPFVQGAEEYLDRAIGWARDAGLSVWVDLHAVAGGQNGFDNCGRRGSLLWGTGDTLARTYVVINKIIEKYTAPGFSDVVIAIEFVNEPVANRIGIEIVKDYYENASSTLRSKSSTTSGVIHDGFMGVRSWDDFHPRSDKLILDVHIYQVFGDQVYLTPEQHVAAACAFAPTLKEASQFHNIVVGEFSNAMTDCTRWLNNFLLGARYDGTLSGFSSAGSCARNSDPASYDAVQMRRFFEAQIQAYEKTDGWIFWTWKTEASPEWDFSEGVRLGWIPQPLNDLKYKPCGDI